MSLFPVTNSYPLNLTYDVKYFVSRNKILDFSDVGAFPLAKQTSSIVRKVKTVNLVFQGL